MYNSIIIYLCNSSKCNENKTFFDNMRIHKIKIKPQYAERLYFIISLYWYYIIAKMQLQKMYGQYCMIEL